MRRVTGYRAVFAAIILVSSVLLVGSLVSSAAGSTSQVGDQWNLTVDEQYDANQSSGWATVVTSHVTGGDITALYQNGTVFYSNDTRDGYWDVDPIPGEENSVVYAATDEVHDESVCEPLGEQDYCIRQIIERANLTTGETEVLYSRVDPWYRYHEWHDVDRINDSHYAVADMYANEVFIMDVTTGIVTWEWNMQNNFSLESGDQFPDDWDHINDVEVLEDGRVMISPRNHDQVLFIDRQSGLEENWTLGADDRHSVLYEQHNPDYFPAEDGGPAVLVADSENDRIIEYERTDDEEWNQSWVWQDEKLEWPRDADRLPNGNTLITDSTGGRVIEIDDQGDVVWNLTHVNHSEGVPLAYEAERLGTGDESAGGESAEANDLPSQTVDDDQPSDQADQPSDSADTTEAVIPASLSEEISAITPAWMSVRDLALLLVIGITAIVWAGVELWWAGFRPRNPITRK